MTVKERIEQLRNLRQGYGRSAAIGFWFSIHGEDMIEEYAKLAELAGVLQEIAAGGIWNERKYAQDAIIKARIEL